MTKRLLFAAAAIVSIPGLAQAQMTDPMGDATVARTEAEAKAGASFDAADADKDGFLSPAEMATAMPGRGPRPAGAPPRAPRPEGAGQRGPGGMMDADKDGKVSKAEFIAGTLNRFDRMDANKDGQLTKAEREDFMAEMMARRMAGMGDGPPQ